LQRHLLPVVGKGLCVAAAAAAERVLRAARHFASCRKDNKPKPGEKAKDNKSPLME
jgi:hypothetical protein